MQATGTTSTEKRLMVICEKRHLHSIMEEFEDWSQKEGLEVKVLLYGTMQKSTDGFLLLALNTPLPEGVYTNLVMDDDIVDYVQYDTALPTPEAPA